MVDSNREHITKAIKTLKLLTIVAHLKQPAPTHARPRIAGLTFNVVLNIQAKLLRLIKLFAFPKGQ